MKRGFWKTVGAILNRPLFGTQVIPPDARADPALLPEEEFPLHCPKCDYLLRGLPEQRCPECGETFDRGRLLVRQYVLGSGSPGWGATPLGRLFDRFAVAGAVLAILAYGLIWVGDWIAGSPAMTNQVIATAMRYPLVGIMFILAPLVLATLFMISRISVDGFIQWRSRYKRRRVIAAIIRPDVEEKHGAQEDAEV